MSLLKFIIFFLVLFPISNVLACVSNLEKIELNSIKYGWEQVVDRDDTVLIYVSAPEQYKDWSLYEISISRDIKPYLKIPLSIKVHKKKASAYAELPKSIADGSELNVKYGFSRCTQAKKVMQLKLNKRLNSDND